jgi:hypothetical protein
MEYSKSHFGHPILLHGPDRMETIDQEGVALQAQIRSMSASKTSINRFIGACLASSADGPMPDSIAAAPRE